MSKNGASSRIKEREAILALSKVEIPKTETSSESEDSFDSTKVYLGVDSQIEKRRMDRLNRRQTVRKMRGGLTRVRESIRAEFKDETFESLKADSNRQSSNPKEC